jgi:hypothetical protein
MYSLTLLEFFILENKIYLNLILLLWTLFKIKKEKEN